MTGTGESDGASCAFPDQRLDVVQELTSVTPVTGGGGLVFDIKYTVRLDNPGSVDAANVQLTEFGGNNTASTLYSFPNATVVGSGVTVSGGLPASAANAAFNGSTNFNLLNGNSTLAFGADVTVSYTLRVTYPSAATVPIAVQNNTIYASSTSSTNPGYSIIGTTILPPADLLAADLSTNGAVFPVTSNGDTASPTPVLFKPTIYGTVYEDVNYGGGNGRTQNGSQGPGRGGARVELFTGTGTTAAFNASTITATDGSYNFTNLTAGTTYTVRVVNNSVVSSRTGATTSSGNGTSSSFVSNQLAVPTYSGTASSVGGADPTKTDGPNVTTGTLANANGTGTTALSIATVALTAAAPSATDISFGFNFDLIVNKNDVGQGSLRQFILNSNALGGEASLAQSGSNTAGTLPAGRETSIFMIPNSQLTGGVAIITPATATTGALPAITGTNTIIDGTTQTQNIGNTNTGTLGTGGFVGAAGTTPLAQLNRPEVQIVGTPGALNSDIGLNIQANNTTIKGLAIYGFGNTQNNTAGGNIGVTSTTAAAITGTLITENVIGTSASSFTDPGSTTTRTTGNGIYLAPGPATATNVFGAIISNNLIGFNGTGGIEAAVTGTSNGTTTGLIVTGNEIRGNAILNSAADGIRVGLNGGYVANNLFQNNQGPGVDFAGSAGNITVTNNTISNNGLNGGGQTSGIRVVGSGSTISQNIISNNYGDGILVRPASGGNTISRNSIFGNGAVLTSAGGAASGAIGIDLLLNSEAGAANQDQGATPFVTLNDAAATDDANGRLRFPVLTSATLQGTNLILKGYATPNASIELFTAKANAAGLNATGANFGQGQTYLTTITAGSTGGTSYSANINGFNQGSDTNANTFSITIDLNTLTAAQKALVISGALLTSTATLTNATSEFSGNVVVNNAPVAQNVTNTVTLLNTSGAVALAPSLSGTASGSANGVANTIKSYTIVSLPTSGTLAYNGTVLTNANLATAGAGLTDLTKLTYTPAAGFANTATFTYTVTDANGVTSTTNSAGATAAATYSIPVNALPVAVAASPASQINPGGTTSVTIPATSFAGTDTNPGTIASLTLTTFPTNATSITVNGTTYTAAGGSGTTAFPVGGISVPTATNGNPTQTISVDPANGAVTVAIPFTVTDNQGAVSNNTATVNGAFTDLTIAGRVFNDVSGIQNTLIDGTATGTPGGVQLYVNLLNAAGTTLLGSATVAADGTYSLGTAQGVAQTTSYRLVLTTSAISLTATAPAGFSFTAEGQSKAVNGTANDGDTTPDGIFAYTTSATSVANVNFAVNHLPVANTSSVAVANPGGTTNTADLSINFGGTDVDPTATATGTIARYIFKTFPAGVTSITIGGTKYSSQADLGTGVTVSVSTAVTGTNPTGAPIPAGGVSIDPLDGSQTVTIPYFVADNALQASAAAGTLTVNITSTLSGVVFEDVNYGGGAGRSRTATGTSVRSGATVELYDNTGAFVASTTTSATGTYSFATQSNTTYTVRVVNSSVSSSRTGYTAGLLPVQTYNGTTDRVGGEYPGRTDAGANTTNATLASLTTGTTAAESIATVSTSTGNTVAGPDFGFNFDLVVNTNASGQGSVAQFVTNANTLGGEASLAQSGSRVNAAGTTVALPAGSETSIFMIPNGSSGVSGLRAYNAVTSPGTASQLQGAVANVGGTTALIAPAAALTLSSTLTVLDGTTQTQNIGNANAGFVPGATATTVGVDGIALPGIQQPEVELSGSFGALIDVEATNVTVRGLALHGGSGGSNETVRVGGTASATGYLLENLVVGSNAAGTRPGINPTDNFGIDLEGQSGAGTVQNSLIAYTGSSGLNVNNGTGTTGTNQFVSNFFLKNGFLSPGGDGISFGDNGGSGLANVANNSFANSNSSALQFETGSTSATTVRNNTIQNAGTVGNDPGAVASNLEGAGIVYLQRNGTNTGSQADVISRNIITNSQASGIVVGYGQQNITISENSTYANGSVGIDLIPDATQRVGNGQGYGNGDGVSGNDGTANPALANRGIDYPVFTSVLYNSATSVTVTGYVGSAAGQPAFGGTKVEVYVADNSGANQNGVVVTGDGKSIAHGEGRFYAGFLTADANGNFTGTLTLPGTLTVTRADFLTATATLTGAGTSEFGPNARFLPVAVDVTNVKIANTSGATVLNSSTTPGTSLAGLTGGTISSFFLTSLPNAAAGKLTYNGTDLTSASLGQGGLSIPNTPASLALLTFTPVAGYVGANATFGYKVADDLGNVSANTATYTIPISNTPLANDDSATTPLNTPVVFAVAANDQANGGAAIAPGTIDLNPNVAGIQDTFVTPEGTFTTVTGSGLAIPVGSVRFTPISATFAGIANTPYTIQNTDGLVSNQANLVVKVQSPVDVATSITSPLTGTSVTAGAQITIQGNTINNGAAGTAVNIAQSVQLPPGLVPADVTISRNGTTFTASGYNATTGLIIFSTAANTGADVLAGTPSPFFVRFTAPLSGSLTVVASVNPTAGDVNLSNNSASIALNVTPQADVFTTITGPTTNPVAGALLTYAVTTGNTAGNFSPVAGLVQTVAVPSGISGVFASNGGVYDAINNRVIFPAVSLAAGQSVNNIISFSAPAAGAVQLTATVPTTNEPTLATQANNTATTTNLTVQTAETDPAKLANVYVTISGPAQATPDASGNYTVAYTVKQGNNGPAAADNVQTVVLLPAGLTPANITVGGTAQSSATYNATTGQLTLPALSGVAAQASGASQTYTIGVTGAATTMVLTASASVTTTSTDPMPANNVATTQTEIIPSADVAITLASREAGNGGQLAAGQLINYQVQVKNNSVFPAQSVQPTVALLPGLSIATLQLNGAAGTLSTDKLTISFGSGAATSTYTIASGVLTLPLIATLTTGTLVNNVITVTVPGSGSLRPLASVTSLTPDANLTNNAATLNNGTNQVVDLTVSLAGPAQVVVGNPVLYTVTTTNNGPSVGTGNQTTTVQLPTGLTGVVVRDNAGSLLSGAGLGYDATTGVVTFAAATLTNAGQSTQGTISFVAPNTNQLSLAAAVAYSVATTADSEPNLTNNSAQLSTVVASPASTTTDLATTFTATQPTAQVPGAALTYTVRTTNNGPATAQSPAQVVNLPAGLSAITLNGTAGTLSADKLTISFGATTALYTLATGQFSIPVAAGTLASGAFVDNTISFVMPATSIALTANSTMSNADSDPTNNVKQTTTAINGQADVALAISGPVTSKVGATVSYLVTSINNGPVTATTVNTRVTLPLATGSSYFVNGSATASTYNGPFNLTTPFNATIAVGGTQTNTISFVVPTGVTNLTVSGQVTATGDAALSGNNISSVLTKINVAPLANDVVNVAQSPQGNSAGPLALTLLSATDSDGSIASYTLTSLPDAATGTLYNNGTAVTSLPAGGLVVNPATLSFDPAAGFVGTAFFTYTATDNGNGNAAYALTSNAARYAIQIGADNASLYTVNDPKGGSNLYRAGEELARVYDYNGGVATTPAAAGKTIFTPNPADRSADYASGISNNGVVSATISAADQSLLTSKGIVFNPATGRITVGTTVAELAMFKLATGSVTISVATVDINGGTNTQPVTFTIGTFPLPVELTDFTATAVRNLDAALLWHTAQEKNNDHFDVERSLTGTDFVKIGQVQGQGSKTTPTAYALTDAGIGPKANGRVYYRLKQVDTDGATSYSPVRTVTFTTSLTPAIGLFPNPATTGTQLDLTQLPSGSYQVSVLDATGRLVLNTTLEAGLTHALDLNTIASGTYNVLVRGQSNGQPINLTKRLIKE